MKDEDWWDYILFLALVDVFLCKSSEGRDTLLAFPTCFLIFFRSQGRVSYPIVSHYAHTRFEFDGTPSDPNAAIATMPHADWPGT